MRRIWLGRDRELGELEAGLRELPAGGSLFLLTGEPGIGKTRLADELGRVARTHAVAVHWGRAWEAGGAPPYWPFVQILRSIARELAQSVLDELTGTHASELAHLLPELRPAAETTAEPGSDTIRDRFQLFDAVNVFLHAVARTRPQLLLLDDLHAADPSSLLLLQFIVRDLASAPLMVVGTYRDAEARLAPEVGRRLALLAREASVLPLRRLTRDEVCQFLAQATGTDPTEAHAALVHERSEGNPLFVRELLQLRGPAASPPEGIREVVRTRLALLPAPVRRALDGAAVLGREFEIGPFAALAHVAEPEARALIATAAEAGVIEPLQQPERWRFAHVLLRDGVYDDIPADRRAALHRAAAAEVGLRAGAPTRLAERAHHLLCAVPAVGAADAVDAVLAAAERAVTMLAFEDACALLARTESLLEPQGDDNQRLFDVRLSFGVARIRAGEVKAGKDLCRRAADLARSLGDGERFARAVLGCACEFVPGVRDHELIGLLEEALAMLPARDARLRVRCMAQLAAERQPEPDTEPPMQLAHEALAMARRLGDPETLRFALSHAGLAMLAFGDPAERLDLDQECLRLALGAGDKIAALRAHLLISADCLQLGDRAGADAHIHAYEALVQLRHSRYRWVTGLLRATRALWDGRFDAAERSYTESMSLWRQDEGGGVEMVAFPVGFCRAAERYDDLANVESHVRSALATVQQDLAACVGEMIIAGLYARAGDRQRSATQLRIVAAHPVYPEITEPVWLALLAEPCHLLGDAALAERLYPALRSHARQFFWLGPLGGYYEAPLSRQLGLLAQTLGRLDEAVDHLTDAERQVKDAGLHSHLARVQYELAGALMARGGPGDDARAARLLHDAEALAGRLGQNALRPLLSRRAQEMRPATEHAFPPGLPSAPPFSLQREGDYWTIACGSRTLRLRDSRGLRALAELVSRPGQELHVLQIAGEGHGMQDVGDAGPVLDQVAIQSYRHRLLELREELEEAERVSDAARAGRAQGEIDVLTRELARAVGLGGRTRRAGLAAERARTAVQKRLRSAIRRIEQEMPELGRHLDHNIRTGTFCGYLPHGRARTRHGADT